MIFGSVLLGSSAVPAPDQSQTQSNDAFLPPIPPKTVIRYNTEQNKTKDSLYLDNKADSLCDTYIKNMLVAQQKLKPLMGTRNYARAVRQELPGAPVGNHCLYGQFTHLARALGEMGDTLTIIPDDARMACINFKTQMRNKYSQYPNCIYEGIMHKSDSAYNAALNRYLRQKNVTETTPDSVRAQYINQFAQKNFNADTIAPGAIMIVPRHRGSRNTFHAIMFLGRGRIENGKFIADKNGQHIYVGHNRETMGDIFRTYDTSCVFAANTRNIVRTEYQQELKRIETMPRDKLVDFLDAPNNINPEYAPHDVLLQMARNKYFNQPLITDDIMFYDFINCTMTHTKIKNTAFDRYGWPMQITR